MLQQCYSVSFTQHRVVAHDIAIFVKRIICSLPLRPILLLNLIFLSLHKANPSKTNSSLKKSFSPFHKSHCFYGYHNCSGLIRLPNHQKQIYSMSYNHRQRTQMNFLPVVWRYGVRGPNMPYRETIQHCHLTE